MGRLELQALLEELLASDHVYFQPPKNTRMEYPCIVYSRSDRDTRHANNLPYKDRKRYQVTVISSDPDSEIPEKIAALPLCRFEQHFTADHLNHDVYQLFF